jgi:hypothetical protein
MKEFIDKGAFLEKMKRTPRYFDVKFDIEEMPTVTEAEIRNKVIDEFAERMQEKVESFQAEINGFKADVLTLDYFSEFVDEIAEQMKGGAV